MLANMKSEEVQIKKTQKIISNKPVSNDEFSYFKKDPSKKTEVAKPKVEVEEDLNLFKVTTVKNDKVPKKQVEDEFDFDF
jgi:hypothetical protein